jgi:hypothetical protein
MRTIGAEDGIALLVAMMALLVISALGSALILLSSSETIIAAHFRDIVATGYAVDATMAAAIDEIAAVDDWVGPITGATRSAFVDGPAAGLRTLPDGSIIDLAQLANLSNCQKTTVCTDADLDAVTPDRPWAANNPRWQLYGFGPLHNLLQGATPIDSPLYVVWLVADDPSGTHRLPPADGSTGRRWEGIALRAEAFGSHGAYKAIEVVAGRSVETPGDENDYNPGAERSAMKILSWREMR